MNKRARAFGLFAGILGICAALAILTNRREAEVAGKPISQWVQDLSGNYTNYSLAQEHLREAGTNAVPFLLHELQQTETSPRRRMQMWWYQTWHKLPPFLQGVTSRPQPPRTIDRRESLRMLAELAPTSSRAVKAIIGELRNQDQGVRSVACEVLGKTGTNHANLVFSNLMVMLQDSDAYVRARAALSLGYFGWNPQVVLPALLQQLDDPKPTAKCAAVHSLCLIPGATEKVLPAFANLLQDPDLMVSSAAGYAICKLTGEAGKPFQSLLRAFNSSNPDAQHSAAKLLSTLGPIAAQATDALEEKLTESNDMVTLVYSAEAHWRTHRRPGSVTHALQRALLSTDRWARIEATDFAREMGPTAAPLLPELTTILQDPDFLLRRNAAKAIGNIGPAAQPAIGELRLLSKDTFPSVRLAAEEALKRIEIMAIPD